MSGPAEDVLTSAREARDADDPRVVAAGAPHAAQLAAPVVERPRGGRLVVEVVEAAGIEAVGGKGCARRGHSSGDPSGRLLDGLHDLGERARVGALRVDRDKRGEPRQHAEPD